MLYCRRRRRHNRNLTEITRENARSDIRIGKGTFSEQKGKNSKTTGNGPTGNRSAGSRSSSYGDDNVISGKEKKNKHYDNNIVLVNNTTLQ